jgi:recyclin-1
MADQKSDEKGMSEAAYASWDVWDGSGNDEWEIGRMWAEKREIFYEQGKWEALANFREDSSLLFDAMVDFMNHITDAIKNDGAPAIRIFPAESRVLLSYADRVALEVVGEYITPLLSHARGITNEVFLQATAASFAQAWRIADALIFVSKPAVESDKPVISTTQAEDVVYRMFEINMDEYLDEEVEQIKIVFDGICRDWDKKVIPLHPLGTGLFLTCRADGPTYANGLDVRWITQPSAG